jgi:hypothetical protein
MTRIGFSAGEIAKCAGVHDIAGQLPDHLIGNAAIHDEAVEITNRSWAGAAGPKYKKS